MLKNPEIVVELKGIKKIKDYSQRIPTEGGDFPMY